MDIDYSKMIEEFMKYELDPAKIKEVNLYEKLLMVRENLNLSTAEGCKAADGFISGATAVLSTKAAICDYYERMLAERLKLLTLQKVHQLKSNPPEDWNKYGHRSVSTWAEEQVGLDAEVQEMSQRLATCNASRHYWEHLIEALNQMGKRVDSAGMLISAEWKRTPVIGMREG